MKNPVLMKAFLVILIILPAFAFGQQDTSYKQFIPEWIKVKPLMDSPNFVADSIRVKMINYFKGKNIDLSRCFIDSRVREDDNHILIVIWDIQDLKNIKIKVNVIKNYQSISGGFEFDKKTKKLTFEPPHDE